MSQRKICVVTGTRAEYGLLYPLIKKINEDKNLLLQLVVTGTHTDKRFGETYKQIEFQIDKKIDLNLQSSQESIAISMGIAQIKFAKYLKKSQPDLLLVLGDRFEIFAVVATAVTLNIPIAHIHGGELTYGAIDDAFRHSITKMSHLHFTSTQEYKNRIIQLGENPQYVHNVGSLGVENIKSLHLLSKNEIEEKLNLQFRKKNILVTYHPETISNKNPIEQIKELLEATKAYPDILFIFTKANADFGGIQINEIIEDYVNQNENMVLYDSLGQLNYFSVLKIVDCVLGNSSSGIIEVPSFKIPTINIGHRQNGRTQCESIINAKCNSHSIMKAINRSYSKKFRKKLHAITNPYEKKGTSEKIVKTLKKVNLDTLLMKTFYDISSTKSRDK